MTTPTPRRGLTIERGAPTNDATLAELDTTRDRLRSEARELLARGDHLEGDDLDRFEQLEADLDDVNRRIDDARRDDLRRGVESGRYGVEHTSPPPADRRRAASGAPVRRVAIDPLAVTDEYLDRVQGHIDDAIMQRAALQTSTFGAGREWGANALDGPRSLYRAAGVPVQGSAAIFAQYPKLTIPAVDAGVGETVTVVEAAGSTAGSLTLKRYGRFTDLSEESLIGASADAIVGLHRVAIARDLDSVLIGLVNTDAGSAIAFAADVKAAIRTSIATVTDATAGTPGQIVVLSHPDNCALLEDVTSTGGRTIGEEFTRFAGSLVYASSAVPTGFMLVANLAIGCRFFVARDIATRPDLAPKTSVLSLTTDIVAGFGTGMVTGYVRKNDVVTP